MIWPGEFVFGYPGQDAMDHVRPGLMANAGPSWGRNGSLLVFRRFRQDVAAFHDFLRNTAADLSRRFPDVTEIAPEWLGAKFIGRWSSGTPLMHAATHDNGDLAENDRVANNFHYAGVHQAEAKRMNGRDDGSGGPQWSKDLLGLACPQAAHIRKAYPRDHATPVDTVASIETHRLLRRGVPFGDPFPAPGERGLLFMAYQTSFERQFEFITRAWLNNPRLREEGDGHDPLIGQSGTQTTARTRQFVLPLRRKDDTIERVKIDLPMDWVTPTGGGYFFVPGLDALRYLADF
jgi:Dyp-type peroxidase family